MPSHRIPLLVLVIVALVMSSLAVYFRVEEQKISVQNQKLLIEIHDLQSPQALPAAAQRGQPSALLDAPITEETALSFFWFGDMDSHFRNPVNFFVVPHADQRLHKVEFTDFITDGQVNMFVSAEEMKRILDGLKALGLSWNDFKGREAFKPGRKRTDDGFLDITLVSPKATAKAYIRIARMCDELSRLDPAMPSPRILWQFQLFRVDNGCQVPGYDNSVVPPS